MDDETLFFQICRFSFLNHRRGPGRTVIPVFGLPVMPRRRRDAEESPPDYQRMVESDRRAQRRQHPYGVPGGMGGMPGGMGGGMSGGVSARPSSGQSARALDAREALRMANGDHAMAFGAMVGHAQAKMVPPGGFRHGTSPGFNYGFGYSFGQALGESRAENATLREELEFLRADHAHQIPELNRFKDVHEQGIDDSILALGAEGVFETKEKFAQRLVKAGLLERQPGAKHEGQHVFHIISASNGGPDHTDNYLYALGGSFNIAIGDRFDHLNCFLAGKAKAQKAVAIAMKVASDESLRKYIDKRGRQRATTFWEGRHEKVANGAGRNAIRTADQLYKMGQDLFRDMRQGARERDRA